MVTRPTRFAPKTLDALVEFLSTRRGALARSAATLNREVADALGGRDSSDALAPAPDADIATHLILIERAKERLQEIDAALERIDSGTYDRSVVCGLQIAEERLEALPAAALCRSCVV